MGEVDFSALSKKERKRLKKELGRQEQEKKTKMAKIVKWLIVSLLILLLLLGGWWIVRELSKPFPGQSVPDLGREHVGQSEWEKYQYNSNPPTSGPHDPVWTKAGIYNRPQGDGYLIHSLEHGYVILHYNCNAEKSKVKSQKSKLAVFAHETGQPHEEAVATDSAEASQSAELKSDVWESDECRELKKQLADLAQKNKLWKLIVVPRLTLDVKIALTAWGRLDKMDKVDSGRINHFIDTFRNKGPEKTIE